MELHLSIHGHNCQVKFQQHHTFQRVIKLLKSNNLIPSDVPNQKIQFYGTNDKKYSKQNYVHESLIPPQVKKCSVRVIYPQISPPPSQIANNGQFFQPQNKKAKLVDIVKGFFQKMQHRQFKKLERYQTHQEQIISAVAKFAKNYQKLYANYLFYKEAIVDLSQKQVSQIRQYRQKFVNQHNYISKIRIQRLSVGKSDIDHQQERASINQQFERTSMSLKEKQQIVNQLLNEMRKKNQQISQLQQFHKKLNQTNRQLLKTIQSLKNKVIEQQQKNEGKNVAQLRAVIIDFQNKILNKQKQIVQKQKQIKKLKQSHTKEMNDILSKHNLELSDRLSKSKQQMTSKLTKTQTDLNQRQLSVKEINEQYSKAKKQILKLESQLNELNRRKKQTQKQKQNLNKQHLISQRQIQKLKQMHKNDKSALNQQIRSLNIRLQAQIIQRQRIQTQKDKIHNQRDGLLKQMQQINTIYQNQKSKFLAQISELTSQKSMMKSSLVLSDQSRSLKLSKMKSIQMQKRPSVSAFLINKLSPIDAFTNVGLQKATAQKLLIKFNLFFGKQFSSVNIFINHKLNIKLPTKKIIKTIKGKQNILIICKTIQGNIVGAFSSLPFDSGHKNFQQAELESCKGFLFNVKQKQVNKVKQKQVNLFELKKGKKPIEFDDDFLIFGDEQLSLEYECLVMSSRFVNNPSKQSISYQDRDEKRTNFLSERSVQKIDVTEYWLMECIFQ